MDTSIGLWVITILGIALLMAVDFLAITRKPHEVKFREALWASIFYVGIAIAFGIFIYIWQGSQYGTEYFAAYLVEKSLSVDNLFVFIIKGVSILMPLM